MMVSARLGAGIGVDQGRGQPRQGVEQVVLGADRDLVRLDRADTGVNDDFARPRGCADPGPWAWA